MYSVNTQPCNRSGGSNTTQKMKFTTDLVIFTEEIFNGKLHLLCTV